MIEASWPDWISATSAAVSALALGIGFWLANKQLGAWRSERLGTRGAEIAEELLTAVYHASDDLGSFRSKLDYMPHDKLGDKNYLYVKRLERIRNGDATFQDLRLKQVRAKAFFGNSELDGAINELFDVKFAVIDAFQELVEEADKGWGASEDREWMRDVRSQAYGSYDERDQLGQKQQQAVQKCEGVLLPNIRLLTPL